MVISTTQTGLRLWDVVMSSNSLLLQTASAAGSPDHIVLRPDECSFLLRHRSGFTKSRTVVCICGYTTVANKPESGETALAVVKVLWDCLFADQHDPALRTEVLRWVPSFTRVDCAVLDESF